MQRRHTRRGVPWCWQLKYITAAVAAAAFMSTLLPKYCSAGTPKWEVPQCWQPICTTAAVAAAAAFTSTLCCQSTAAPARHGPPGQTAAPLSAATCPAPGHPAPSAVSAAGLLCGPPRIFRQPLPESPRASRAAAGRMCDERQQCSKCAWQQAESGRKATKACTSWLTHAGFACHKV